MVKYAKIRILMVSSVLRNTSQVEHTKKHSRIDSENKSGKRNTGHQNHLSVFLRFTLALIYSKKAFLVEQNALPRSAD